jgi:phage FluMu gp28-like protein
VEDEARFKIWLAARQTGKSFAAACEVVQDCFVRAKTTWVILSAGERQSLEFMEKVKQWTEAFGVAIEQYVEVREHAESLIKSAEVRLANGSRIIALPANPDTARGYSANLVLDEFAFHQDSGAIWRAILPSIANPLRGELKVRVLSTPNGQGNAFYTLWTDRTEGTDRTDWSRHRTTIYDAVAAGLGVDVEGLRRQFNDPDGWAQEFECQFIDGSSVLLPYEVLAACESPEATETDVDGVVVTSSNARYLGIDIGRKHDLTVAWEMERIGDVLWTRSVRVLERMAFAQQLEILSGLCGRAAVTCVDGTGIGAMLAEELVRRHGEWRVEACQFTAQFKQELYPPMRRKFEDKLIRIPVSRAIREDLHGVQKVSTSGGLIRYVAPHTEDGHCDRATALALAIRAAGTEAPGTFRRVAGGRWNGEVALARRERSLVG